MFNLTTAEQGLFLCAEPHRALLVQPALLRCLAQGAVSMSPWAEPQLRLAVAVLTVQAAGTWNSHVPQHAVPFLTQQDILGDFTMGTQGKNQSLTKQDGIFSMILPVVQHLGSPDIIKLCLVVPSFLSTGRSSFKQLFS